MATYKKFETAEGQKMQVESAIRDGEGKNISNNYAKQDGTYETLFAGNVQSSVDKSDTGAWYNRTTCETSSTIDGIAKIKEIRGRKYFDNASLVTAKLSAVNATGMNLYNRSTDAGYMRIPANIDTLSTAERDIRISGTYSSVQLVNSIGATSGTPLTVTTKTHTAPNGQVITYNCFNLPADSGNKFIHVEGDASDTMLMFVWSGYNTGKAFMPYEEFSINTSIVANQFPNGMMNIVINGEEKFADAITFNGLTAKVFKRVASLNFAEGNISFSAKSGNLYRYRLTASGAIANGFAELMKSSTGASVTTIPFSATSSGLTAECYVLTSDYVDFYLDESHAIQYNYTSAPSYTEGKTYYYLDNGSYVEDTAVVDAESFASELVIHGTLYTRSEENVGASYIASLADYVFYQKLSSTSSGTSVAISYAYQYHESDFGIEWLTYSGTYPTLVIDYPLDIKATVQKLPSTYVSLSSAENMLHQVGDLQGFNFTNISVNDNGDMQVNGLVDTKETIVNFNTNYLFNFSAVPIGYANRKPIPEESKKILQKYLYSRDNGALKFIRIKETNYVIVDAPIINKRFGVSSNTLSYLQFIIDGRIYTITNINSNPTWYRNV